MDIRITWPEFQLVIDSDQLPVNYIDKDGNYYLFTTKLSNQLVCVLDKNDATDFENNYKDSSTSLL